MKIFSIHHFMNQKFGFHCITDLEDGKTGAIIGLHLVTSSIRFLSSSGICVPFVKPLLSQQRFMFYGWFQQELSSVSEGMDESAFFFLPLTEIYLLDLSKFKNEVAFGFYPTNILLPFILEVKSQQEHTLISTRKEKLKKGMNIQCVFAF